MTGQSDERLDAAEQRWGSLVETVIPFVGLAIGTALTPFIISATASFWLLTGVLVALSATWSYVFTTRSPARAAQPRAGAVYVVGLLGLMATLVFQSPLYGFQAIAGYLHSVAYLRGRWRVVGVVVTALLVAYCQIGGRFVTTVSTGTVLGLLGLTVVNAAIGGGFTWLGMSQADQGERRRHIIEELNETNRRLEETLTENAELQAQLVAQARDTGIQDERARIAREIHDTLAQDLAGIVAQLEAAATAEEQPATRRRHVDTARALARESLTEARRSLHALTPGPLQGERLPDAIADLAKRWADDAGVDATVDTTGSPRPLLADLEVTLFRVAQEALANVAKHAAATKVGITLSYMPEEVVLDVRDDGVGFIPGEHQAGYGLLAMRQRLARVSGRLEVESTRHEGTAVSASVPALGPEPAP
jgi:signal transduction histidine kinase